MRENGVLYYMVPKTLSWIKHTIILKTVLDFPFSAQ